MIPPQMQMMFKAMVLPTLQQMSVDELLEIREFANDQIDSVIAAKHAAVTDGARVTEPSD